MPPHVCSLEVLGAPGGGGDAAEAAAQARRLAAAGDVIDETDEAWPRLVADIARALDG